jgi:major capsid protein gp7
MATIGTAVNLIDFAKRLDPDGGIAAIAEILSQANDLIPDIMWREGNLPTGDRVTVRTGLPSIFFRMINQGIPSSKSTTAQIDEGTAMMEARGQIDQTLAQLNGLESSFRASENAPFLEAMAQTFARTFWYGNTGLDPEQFTGMSPRYSDDSGPANAENIINAGGVGSDNTSIWLIGHGDQGIYGITPKGLPSGLTHEDLGLQDAFDASAATPTNNRFRAYMDLYQWKCGVCVKDWRYAVRIANIDVSNLVAETSAADILELMAVAVDKPPSLENAKWAFYCSRTVRTMLRIQCMQKPNVYLNLGQEEGQRKLNFDSIPIRLSDQLLATEAAVA